MNTNKKMAILATVAFSLFTCISCDKEQSLTESHNLLVHKVASENIPVFSSWESLQTAIDSALSFDTVSDLINYESKQGRQSVGAISDNFYESIDPNSFVDEEQFISFYRNNKDLLDTSMVEGEICVSPKWFDTPYRYVANQNGLFAVDDLIYRLFKAGIVATKSENLDRLISLNESDLDNIDTSIFYYSKPVNATPSHSGCLDDNEDWYYSNTLSTAKNRVIVELNTRILFCPNIGFFYRNPRSYA